MLGAGVVVWGGREGRKNLEGLRFDAKIYWFLVDGG